MGMNLPNVRPVKSKGTFYSPEGEYEEEIYEFLKEKGPVFTKRLLLAGTIAGLKKKDILSLIQAGLYKSCATKYWSDISVIYQTSAHDPQMTSKIMSAGLNIKDFKQLAAEDKLDEDTIDLFRQLNSINQQH